MERMGGTVEATSTVGHGSVFAAELALEVAGETDVESDHDSRDTTRMRGMRVLLAEDDLVDQTVATHMLRRLGIEPTVVGDGAAAVDAALSGHYDVVLMDVHMSTMDGVEATHAIRDACADAGPRILAVTANALEGDRERLLAAGMDGYLSKPFQLAALARALAGALPEPSHGEARTDGGRAGEPSPVDVEGFADRTGMRDERLLVELVEAVVLQARVVLDTHDADLEDLHLQAHTLSGAAASSSVGGIEGPARSVELAAAARDREAVVAGLASLDRALADVEAWLAPRRGLPVP